MRKRSRVIPLHLTDRELRQLNEKAERSGLSREELLRSLIRGVELRARPCEHHADLLHKAAGLCNNANQLARRDDAHRPRGLGGGERQMVKEALKSPTQA